MIDRLQIPADLREKIDRELGLGEVIHWIDQPIARFFAPGTIGIFLFGIIFTTFSLFWTWGASGFGSLFINGFTPTMLLSLFGVPFILIGFSILSIPFTTKKEAKKTVYIITDQRAISFEGDSPMTIRSYLPNQLQNVHFQENKDGSGNVMIGIHYAKDSEAGEIVEYTGFRDIRDPKGAERFLRRLADINI